MEVLNEMSSINRLLSFMDKYDIACITASRDRFKNATDKTLDDRPEEMRNTDTEYKYTDDENKERNRQLKAALLNYNYGVTNISGIYIEDYGTPDAIEVAENTFFVVNLNDDPDFYQNIFALSEFYGQDCFLYKQKFNNNAYNIGTNYAEYPGYGYKDDLGPIHVNIKNEFKSRIKANTFSFTNADIDALVADNDRRDDFQTRKKRRTLIAKALGLTVYEEFSRGSRMSIRAICESLSKNGLKPEQRSLDDEEMKNFKI